MWCPLQHLTPSNLHVHSLHVQPLQLDKLLSLENSTTYANQVGMMDSACTASLILFDGKGDVKL